MSPNKAVRIVDFESQNSATNKPLLNVENLEAILNQGARDIPTSVISVGGVARSGKSFLLNLIVSYLTYIEKNGSDDGWENSDIPVKGVNWAQQKTSVTHGIWMWDRPFIINRKDGSKVAILLVDSQGTGDNRKSDVNLDTLIMYISLQLSSIQVLNVNKYLSSDDMFSLKLCADFADIDGAQTSDTGEHLFESLAFLIRDEQSGAELGEDPSAFNEMRREIENPELKKVGEGINKAFRNITTFNMPHPGRKISVASSSTHEIRIKDIPEDFRDAAKEVIKKLCGMTPSKCMGSSWDNGEELLMTFKNMKNHFENDDLPQINSPTEAFKDIILNRAYISTQKAFNKEMIALYENDGLAAINSTGELHAIFGAIKDRAAENFKQAGRHKKYGRSSMWRKYEEMLQSLFESAFSHLKLQYDLMIKFKRIEQESEKTRQKLDHQAEMFENSISTLKEEHQLTKKILVEQEEAQNAKEQQHKRDVEELKREIEEAKNDEEEKERLREEISQRNIEAERVRAENEKAQLEQKHQMELLNAKICEMNTLHQKEVEKQEAETRRMAEELKREQDERRRDEERRSKDEDNAWKKQALSILSLAAAGMFKNYMNPDQSTPSTMENGLGNPSKPTPKALPSSKPPASDVLD